MHIHTHTGLHIHIYILHYGNVRILLFNHLNFYYILNNFVLNKAIKTNIIIRDKKEKSQVQTLAIRK